ncbi:hypothetical protein GCM10020220_114330 [Nonomuraea rubra]
MACVPSRTGVVAWRYLPLSTSLSAPPGSAVRTRPVMGAFAEARTTPERSADRYGAASARSVNGPSGTTAAPSAALIAK